MAKATRIRYLILGMAMVMYFITFLDRVNVAVAGPMIAQEYNFDKVTMGAIFSAFTLGYAIFQVPGGWLADKFGPRRILPTMVTWWSLFTAGTILGFNYISFLVIRFIFGCGEAGAFPATARALSKWLQPSERGLSQGLLQSATRIGSACTPPLIAAIIAISGWRAAFIFCALIGFVWAVGWWIIYRDNPEDHPWVNKEELDFIKQGNAGESSVKKGTPWGEILSSKVMWSLSLSYMCLIYTTYIYFNWFPTYLMQAKGFPLLKMGIYASLPFLAGAIANTFGGWFSDRLVRTTGNIKLARRIVPCTGMISLAFFMVPGALVESVGWSVFLLSMALACSEFGIGVYWAVCLDIGNENAGTVSGVMNMFGNLGGFISPLVFGYIVQTTNDWNMPFLVAAGVSVVGALFWFIIDPTEKIIFKDSVTAENSAGGNTQ